MYQNRGINNENNEIATEKRRSIKYKPISGRLHRHFGFKLLADGIIKNSDNVYCIHCDKSFAYHGSNTSLTYHLQNKHSLQYSKLQLAKSASFSQFTAAAASSSKQTTLNEFCRRSDQPVSATVQRDIKMSLANWIVSSGRPISIVEDNGLKQVLRIALQNAEYKLPCRRTIDKILTDMYNTKMESIKETVKNSKAIALTSDFWTSLGNDSYCGIICHLITDDWNLKSVVLECVHFVERHYSANIAELYKQFAKDWDIARKIQVLVTDNARNMVSAVNQTSFAHIPCLAHSLQLCILHGFKAANTEILFFKCRKIIGHFKHSAVNTTELQNCSDSPLRKLQQDVPTRWNSVFEMLQSLLQAREALTLYMSDKERRYEGPKLFDSDWEKIAKFVKVLDIFRQATVLLGGDKYVVCSCVLPLLSSLTKHMTVNDDDPGYIARFKEASVNDFSERVADMKSIAVLKIATALDPRYKNLKCLSDDAKEQTWSLIEQQIANDDWLKTNVQDDIDSVNNTLCEPKEKRFKLMESDSDSEEGVESASDEVQRYRMEKKVDESVDPLQWWKLNEYRYPTLAFLAKTVLCIPATSVPCERLFSSAGYIVNKTRSSLEPNTVNMLVCLRSWLSDDI